MSKVVLGTAQLGLNYGIANLNGKIAYVEALKILSLAHREGIEELDTARVYGDSEKVIGGSKLEFKVITKLPKYDDQHLDVQSYLELNITRSKKDLKQDSLHAVLFHDSTQLLSKDGDNLYSSLSKKKEDGEIKSIGVSVYEPLELMQLLNHFTFDLIQIPNNIFDSRWDEILLLLHQQNIEVHARSIFLQGAVFLEEEKKIKQFYKWKKLWLRFEEWVQDNNTSYLEACLMPMINDKYLSKIVLGVDSAEHLKGILKTIKKNSHINKIPEEIKTSDPELLNPMNWEST